MTEHRTPTPLDNSDAPRGSLAHGPCAPLGAACDVYIFPSELASALLWRHLERGSCEGTCLRQPAPGCVVLWPCALGALADAKSARCLACWRWVQGSRGFLPSRRQPTVLRKKWRTRGCCFTAHCCAGVCLSHCPVCGGVFSGLQCVGRTGPLRVSLSVCV